MKYYTCQEMAQQWNISDRRIRKLIADGRIPGVKKEGKEYLIPMYAEKPVDLRFSENTVIYKAEKDALYYLKWQNDVLGIVTKDWEVEFEKPNYNPIVSLYTKGDKHWTKTQLEEFLSDRIVSSQRRDIEKVLKRLNITSYDIFAIASQTKAISAKDLLWFANSTDEKFEDAISDVFESIFMQALDKQGDSVDTPEGNNIKRYGVYNGRYGIYKQRISPLSTDCESELAVYKLATLLNVPCCKVYKVDDNTIFSEFEYDFSKEYIIHFRRLMNAERSDNEYQNLISIRPCYQKEFAQMIALDFITRQDDRHLSNIAVKITDEKESFYPLYDNGRSLFYEDTEETTNKAVLDIQKYSTSFGPRGTYYDFVKEIASNGVDFKRLLNLNVTREEIQKILTESGFKDYRLKASEDWICKAIELLQTI